MVLVIVPLRLLLLALLMVVVVDLRSKVGKVVKPLALSVGLAVDVVDTLRGFTDTA